MARLYAATGDGFARLTESGDVWKVELSLVGSGLQCPAVEPAEADTEPSRLFRGGDKGESWRELKALVELPSRPHWSFPPRPWTSHVR